MWASRHLLLALAACAVLSTVARVAQRIGPAFSNLAVQTEEHFTEGGGWYRGEPLVTTTPVRAWGSWTGNDAHTGALTLGPFPAPARLRLAVGGYPKKPGNSLEVELAATGERIPFPVPHDIGERWKILACEIPARWIGQPVRLLARDRAGDLGGWLALSEPLRGGRGEGNHAFYDSLAAFAGNGLLLLLLWQGALGWLGRRGWFAPSWLPLAAGGAVTAAAYAVFWATLAHPVAGLLLALALLAVAAVAACRIPAPAAVAPDARLVARLLVAIGLFHLALLHLYPTALSFDDLAANRFRARLPSDNVLPFDVASRLFAGLPPTPPGAEWQSSDRPPIQVGWELLTWGLTNALGFDPRTASGTAALWFQLLWVPAVYGLLRTLRLDPRRAAAWTAVLALSGFFLQNTVFTWPKLSSAALMCGAWAQWLAPPGGAARLRDFVLGAVLAALAWLTHAGIAFSLLALAPWVLWQALRGRWRGWLLAGGAFLLLALPWLGYQRFYEPPANRLLKWHLGGQEARDPRGTWETIRDGYLSLSYSEIIRRKTANLRIQLEGNWHALGDFSFKNAPGRRQDEFFLTGRALTWWVGGLGLLGFALLRRRSREPLRATGRLQANLVGWTLLTVLLWCLLMFPGRSAVIHQGSYVVMLVLFAVLSVWIEAAGRGWLLVVALLQAATLATTYAVPNEVVTGPPLGLPFVVLGAAGLAAFVVAAGWRHSCGWGRRPRSSSENPVATATALAEAGYNEPLPPPPDRPPRNLLPTFRAWWRQPHLTWWAVAALAALLALRKPSAVFIPQLWAEDGSIFLLDQDRLGLAAFFQPYMGYLHAIPRLVAWLAAHLLDPAYWPAFYNGVALALWVAVIARTFSPRLPLPHKPWLALAFILGPQTGEILLNLTNAQWITAFVLVQQAIIDRPRTWLHRLGDLALVALVGLTGPFIAIAWPLLAWRWWRDRHPDNLAVLLVATAAAATQAWFLHQTNIHFEHESAPLQLFDLLTVLARRLVVWPIGGPHLALHLPAFPLTLIGFVAAAALVFRAFRPHPLRSLRLPLLAACALLLAAGLWRTRPDTWEADDLIYSDRYFFLSRVLLVWLVVLEIDAAERAIAWAARLAALAFALVHLPGYVLPAPGDYRWAAHCDPIRRGVPANILILPDGWILEYPGRPGSAPAQDRPR